MSRLSRHSGELRLCDVKQVGTHDAATYSIDEGQCLSSLSRTQRLDITHQLALGVRYFDIRYAPGPNFATSQEFNVYHGHHRGCLVTETITQVIRFLEEYPDEFITLVFKFEKKSGLTINSQQTELFLNQVLALLASASLTQEDFEGWFKGGKVTLTELMSRQKRVMMVVHNDILKVPPAEIIPEFKKFLTQHNIWLHNN